MDWLEDTRLFVRVADTKSFTQTGEALELSASTVSRRVATLEETLKVRLLHRTTRQVSLTEAGELYYRRAVNILAEVESSLAELQDLEQEPRGTLRLAVPFIISPRLMETVEAFQSRYPKVNLDLHYGMYTGSDLIEQAFDVAIVQGLPEATTLVARKLLDNRLLLCGSPDYLDRHGVPTRPEHLERHDCLISTGHADPGDQWTFQIGSRRTTIPVSGKFRANNRAAVQSAALRGMGLACLTIWRIEADLREGRLRTVLDEFPLVSQLADDAIYVVYPSQRFLTLKVRAFMDFLSELAEESKSLFSKRYI